MANDAKFEIGMKVWVIERDEDGNAAEISGYIFLAHVREAVICTSSVNDYDLDGILAYHIQCTAEDYEASLCVFPDEDCYISKESAMAALKAERREGE